MPDPRPGESDEIGGLLVRLGQGDRPAMRALEAAMGRQIRAVAGRFTGSDDDGDEVAQDAMVKVWKNAHRFDPARGTGRAWVYAIVRNAARDRLRRRRLRWLVGFEDLVDEPADAGAGPERSLAARSDLAMVRRALGDLPDRQRYALLLASVGDLETPEITDILGTSRGAVEQLLVRARARLRQVMGKDRDDG